MQTVLQKHIHPEGPNRKTLILHLTPQNSSHKTSCSCNISTGKDQKNLKHLQGELITDITKWKSKMHLYPTH